MAASPVFLSWRWEDWRMLMPGSLLASILPGRLDERVRDRIIAESGENPLASLELPRGVTAADLPAC